MADLTEVWLYAYLLAGLQGRRKPPEADRLLSEALERTQDLT